jgi:hypothetical protein
MTLLEDTAKEILKRARELEPIPTNGWKNLILGGTMMYPYDAKDECKNCGKQNTYYVCYESGFFCSWGCYNKYHESEG